MFQNMIHCFSRFWLYLHSKLFTFILSIIFPENNENVPIMFLHHLQCTCYRTYGHTAHCVNRIYKIPCDCGFELGDVNGHCEDDCDFNTYNNLLTFS